MEQFLVLVAVVFGAIALFGFRGAAGKHRRDELMKKYGNEKIVEAIIAKKIWQGMTEEQLVDSWGGPASVDERQYRARVRRVYKYNQLGKNRFKDRVKVENGSVIGWNLR